MSMESINLAMLMTIIGAITALTNIIVQVVKHITWDKLPTNFVALAVAEILTLCAGGAYAQIHTIPITWYLVVGAVAVGFMSAYAAMFGFDKLREAVQSIGGGANEKGD